MRFMVITKATADSEAGVLPATEDFDTMGNFIQELVDAGALLDAGGLQSSAKGARIYFDGDKRTVVDGPFTETKELIAGYYLVEMKSLEECVAWFYTPMALPLLETVPARSVVYDCMDELSAFKFAPPELLRREEELLRAAGLSDIRLAWVNEMSWSAIGQRADGRSAAVPAAWRKVARRSRVTNASRTSARPAAGSSRASSAT